MTIEIEELEFKNLTDASVLIFRVDGELPENNFIWDMIDKLRKAKVIPEGCTIILNSKFYPVNFDVISEIDMNRSGWFRKV